jgi:hypothetical protein
MLKPLAEVNSQPGISWSFAGYSRIDIKRMQLKGLLDSLTH